MDKVMTVVYALRQGSILLGLKKVRLGKGLITGPGGRQEKHETIEQNARKELRDETGLEAMVLKKVGIVIIANRRRSIRIILHYFIVTRSKGVLKKNSDEMAQLKWSKRIPYKKMWPSDRYLLPIFLADKKCIGHFHYSGQKKRILKKYKLEKVDILPRKYNKALDKLPWLYP